MMMQYRKLGNTGYDVSTIGFGTWQLGGERWSDKGDQEAIGLLQQANDLGVNVFDVAVVYGQYKDDAGYLQSRAQERLGRAFCDRRDRVIYCLKLGQFDEITHRHDYDPKRLVAQFQQSLRRLQTDYIDICLIHAPSVHQVKSARAISVLQTLQALGWVKSIGYSFEAEPEHVFAAIEQPIDVLMLQYNLLDTECAAAIVAAAERGVGLLAGGPFKRGYLTGEYRTLDALPQSDDYWRMNTHLNPGKVEQCLARVNTLLDKYKTPVQLRQHALRFILEQAGIASCVVGHRTLSEVQENIQSIKDAGNTVASSIPYQVVTSANH